MPPKKQSLYQLIESICLFRDDRDKAIAPFSNREGKMALTKLRDTLLPKLISGELCGAEAEQLIEEAIP